MIAPHPLLMTPETTLRPPSLRTPRNLSGPRRVKVRNLSRSRAFPTLLASVLNRVSKRGLWRACS